MVHRFGKRLCVWVIIKRPQPFPSLVKVRILGTVHRRWETLPLGRVDTGITDKLPFAVSVKRLLRSCFRLALNRRQDKILV
jgi:hypothetical protein